MKRQRYIATNELMDLFKVGIMAAEFRTIADKSSTEKDWQKKLRIMATYCENIMNQRFECLDADAAKTVKRRYEHTEIKFISVDDWRSNRNRYEKEGMLTIEAECLYDVLDLAMLTCYKCPQGACVKDCKWRKRFHELAVPVFRTEPKEGECEFRYEPIGTVRNVNPLYRTVEILAEEQKQLNLRGE